MLDNQTPDDLRALVGIARDLKPEVILEASGGRDHRERAGYAETGVDIISTSAITMGVHRSS